MLTRLRPWRPLRLWLSLWLPYKPLIPVSLFFTKPSVSALTIATAAEPAAGNHPSAGTYFDPIDPIREILSGLKGKDFFVNRCLLNLVPTLSSLQVDEIIDNLGGPHPESAIEFFYFLKNGYGFRHSRASQFAIAHLLARKRRPKELSSLLQQMLQEEGTLFV